MNPCVSEFITDTKHWDIPKLWQFVNSDLEVISKIIPLSWSEVENMWVWHYDNRGTYSVKSGYTNLA